MPSRAFPWVGIGYPVVTMPVIPGVTEMTTYLGARDPYRFTGSVYDAVLTVIPFLQIIALAWGDHPGGADR
ncbi:hypothetical protein [Acidipropionibacterium virtanenii]|uniref:Uncharacterized protein n=1 Tax=Acidipropionibacterium virtanenii TaxID=2057246 RepID=A0A344UXS6_9ACTN|nr:hypothetical protein [Acidipropionibacterium virtanenii]AXE40074.1 hypothetical protein JS278_02940 [Acidipropionibacterium virtanenii]